MQPGLDELRRKALARQDEKKASPAVLFRRSHGMKPACADTARRSGAAELIPSVPLLRREPQV